MRVACSRKNWSRSYERLAARKGRRTLNMKRKRHTPDEIIKKLRESATLLAGGQRSEKVCKKL